MGTTSRTPVVLAVSNEDPWLGLTGTAAGESFLRLTLAPQGPVLTSIEEQAADLVVLDFASIGPAARELMACIRERWSDLPLIVLRPIAGIDDLADALGAGAADVVAPGSTTELALAVQKALVRLHWSAELPPPPSDLGDLILGRSRAMQALAEELRQIGPSMATVLVRGESGTGKELVARALHRASARADKPFIKIDCASLPDTLLESELFGYEKGAFTGAVGRKLGRVEVAQGGVLFLDETGELSLTTQAKLLRLLQDREIERLGGTRPITVDVRVIAATHRDLEGMVDRGEFRQDLFYRLNVVPIWLPPLRARRDDIEELAIRFCAQAVERNQRPALRLEPDALQLLGAQRWPGNVRQLQNFVERLVVLCRGTLITATDVRAELDRPTRFPTETGQRGRPPETTGAEAAAAQQHLSEVVRDAERRALLSALERAGGSRSVAARLLGISRSTLYAKLKECGLD